MAKCWIASVSPSRRSPPLYVSELPGEGGVDWGYDFDPERAKCLTEAQARRFRDDATDARGVSIRAGAESLTGMRRKRRRKRRSRR